MPNRASNTHWSAAVVAIMSALPAFTAPSPVAERAPRTGLVYHESYLQHDTGGWHPERAARLVAILTRLKESGTLSGLALLEPSPAPVEWLTTIHTPEYVREVEESCKLGNGPLHSRDTPISSRSYEVARLAAGGVLTAIDAVMTGKVRNAFCAIRPPGHHALANRAMGFCLFNNVAIGARYVQRKHGLKKVLIVDWDVHHGNGTQAAFYEDPTVLYFSTHHSPFYPGTGSADERGTGEGAGYTVNVPLPAGAGDAEYLRAFREVLKPKALAFHPDFVLVSAGFDAHEADPLGGMKVTTAGFAEMTTLVREIAEECCAGRLVSVLEGGYDLDALADSVSAHLAVLQGPRQPRSGSR
jgi:acetoin utilization deacetylase AcuC-like enzyme